MPAKATRLGSSPGRTFSTPLTTGGPFYPQGYFKSSKKKNFRTPAARRGRKYSIRRQGARTNRRSPRDSFSLTEEELRRTARRRLRGG